jgi:sigma-B regulation protein RsbU (phosphoserine phosphatase)
VLFAGCSDETAHNMVLAVDEALQNVIRHGYEFDPDGEIEITLQREGNRIIFLIRDHAKIVDPTRIKPRKLDDIRPGGLGTHFIREVMDEVEFLEPPKDGGNLLKMVRKID